MTSTPVDLPCNPSEHARARQESSHTEKEQQCHLEAESVGFASKIRRSSEYQQVEEVMSRGTTSLARPWVQPGVKESAYAALSR